MSAGPRPSQKPLWLSKEVSNFSQAVKFLNTLDESQAYDAKIVAFNKAGGESWTGFYAVVYRRQ